MEGLRPSPVRFPTGIRYRDLLLHSLLIFTFVLNTTASDYEKSVAPFEFPRANGGESFRSADQSNFVIVIDFFAPWCVSCIEVTKIIETEVKSQYLKTPGPTKVDVLAVNVDQRRPRQTQRFLERAGLEVYFDDPAGAFFESLNPRGLPFVVVLAPQGPDGGRAIVFSQTGLKDTAALRSSLDDLLAAPPSANNETAADETRELTSPDEISEVDASSSYTAPLTPLLAESESEPETANEPIFDDFLGETTDPTPSPSSPIYEVKQAEALVEVFQDEEGENKSGNSDSIPLPNQGSQAAVFSHRIDNVVEYMSSDDVRLLQYDLQWELEHNWWRITQAASLGRIEVDYLPAETALLGDAADLEESNWSYTTTGAWIGQQHSLSLSASRVEGFQDYRSIWLAEFYRQDFQNDPLYSEPAPCGTSVFGSAEWTGFNNRLRLTLDAAYRWDEVAPAYERVIPINIKEPITTEVGMRDLETLSIGLETDYILTDRTRIRSRVSVDDTTSRKLRWNGELAVKRVIGESWVVSFTGTRVSEGSDFSAWTLSGGIDYDLGDVWFIGFFARQYEDDGLVRDATLVSAESPPLETLQTGIRLARIGERTAASLSLFNYNSDYDPVGPNAFQFENLYRDRNWLGIRAAFSIQF